MGRPRLDGLLGQENPSHGVKRLSTYLLDTTVLIAHLRGDEKIAELLLSLVAGGHSLAITCVNIAEIERGIRPKERKAASSLLERLDFLETTREAARRAGRYQADFQSRGRTIHTADALIAGTARAHGAIVLTDNLQDFPMKDIRAESPPSTQS